MPAFPIARIVMKIMTVMIKVIALYLRSKQTVLN